MSTNAPPSDPAKTLDAIGAIGGGLAGEGAAGAESAVAAAASPIAPAFRRARAWTSIGSHSFVDFLSFVPIALMPVIKQQAQLTDGQVALAIATHVTCSGAIQPLAAWISDKFDQRVIGAIGVLAAGLGVGGLMWATTFEMLILLTLLTAGGVGAFHPPAAAAVGSLAGVSRGRWMSLFFVAGMLGGVMGNVLSPQLQEALGMVGLAWLMVPAVLVGLVLWAAIRRVPHRAHGAHDTHAALPAAERRARWASVWLLYGSNVIRFGVNNALIFLMIVLLERQVLAAAQAEALTAELAKRASAVNGTMQAAMQIGMGGGGLVIGWFVARHHEKLGLVLTPILGAIALSLIPVLAGERLALFTITIVAGVGFGSMIPVTLSLAQRLLPHRTSLASAMMLGGAWMFAGVGALGAQLIDEAFGLDAAFVAAGAALLVAGVLSALLPSALLEKLDH